VNDAPTISVIANQTVNEDTPTETLYLQLEMLKRQPQVSLLQQVRVNTTVVPNANITLGGTGPSRTINIAPAASESE
jgi:hypothetical protein